MKFIHVADIHLGANPDAGNSYTENRPKELWNSFERLLEVCEEEKIDLLLIAGDLFHRQPLLRELKEVDYLFSRLTHTRVVLIAGNHDYLKSDSYYRTFKWSTPVHMFLSQTTEYVEYEDLGVCIYGLSYEQKEITEGLYDGAFPARRQPVEILLAHGGDEKHIPIKRNQIINLGYDYVALGHIHKAMEIEKNRIYYAGSLEPTDKNDTGKHGYIKGEIVSGNVVCRFVPFASREYIHMEVETGKTMTSRAVRERVAEEIRRRGVQNLYKIVLTGYRDPDIIYELSGMDVYGNLLEIVDDTKPAYDFEKLEKQNAENLLGRYIRSLKGSEEGSVEYQALLVGVQALLDTKQS